MVHLRKISHYVRDDSSRILMLLGAEFEESSRPTIHESQTEPLPEMATEFFSANPISAVD